MLGIGTVVSFVPAYHIVGAVAGVEGFWTALLFDVMFCNVMGSVAQFAFSLFRFDGSLALCGLFTLLSMLLSGVFVAVDDMPEHYATLAKGLPLYNTLHHYFRACLAHKDMDCQSDDHPYICSDGAFMLDLYGFPEDGPTKSTSLIILMSWYLACRWLTSLAYLTAPHGSLKKYLIHLAYIGGHPDTTARSGTSERLSTSSAVSATIKETEDVTDAVKTQSAFSVVGMSPNDLPESGSGRAPPMDGTVLDGAISVHLHRAGKPKPLIPPISQETPGKVSMVTWS